MPTETTFSDLPIMAAPHRFPVEKIFQTFKFMFLELRIYDSHKNNVELPTEVH